MRILVVYDSKTGNTEKMASAIAEGAKMTGKLSVVVKKADETTNSDLLAADAIIAGSPVYYGQMSGKLKTMFDNSIEIHGKLEGKIGAAFTSSGGVASGAETTILSILEAMLVHGMIVQGRAHAQHYGVAAVGKPEVKETEKCRDFGQTVAKLALKLKG